MPPALEAWSLNHWTTREVPVFIFLMMSFKKQMFIILINSNLWIFHFLSQASFGLSKKSLPTYSKVMSIFFSVFL